MTTAADIRALRSAGEINRAIDAARRWVALAPDLPEPAFELAEALREGGDLVSAREAYARVVELMPHHTPSLNALAGLLLVENQFASAELLLRRLIEISPRSAAGWANLGIAHYGQKRYPQAVEAQRRSLEIRPNHPQTMLNLAQSLIETSEIDEAGDLLDRVLSWQADNAVAVSNQSYVRLVQGRFDEAAALARQYVSADPGALRIVSHLVFVLLHSPGDHEAEIALLSRHFGQCVTEALGPVGRPAYRRSARPSPASQDGPTSIGRVSVIDAQASESTARAGSTSQRPMHIGIISPDLRRHVVSSFAAPLVRGLVETGLARVTCFSTTRHGDELTDWYRASSHGFHALAHLTDAEAARTIEAQSVDVLIDLAGHTSGSRLEVLALRPAPVCATVFGYPHTTGLPQVDFRITDGVSDPVADARSAEPVDRFYTERLLRLPRPAWCYQPMRPTPCAVESPCQRAGHVTFGSLNKGLKLNRPLLDTWAAILRRVDRSRLVLLVTESRRHEDWVIDTLARAGIERSRVTTLRHLPPDRYMAMFAEIDIMLDPFPYNGGVTTADALYMATPVVTLIGSTYRGRQGLMLLRAIGLDELAAESVEGYIEQASLLARDPQRLAALRGQLRGRMETSALMDARGYAAALTAALERGIAGDVVA